MRNNYAFSAVDNKSTAVRHERKITHKNFGFFYFAAFFVEQAGGDSESGCIGSVALFALFHAVIWFIVVQFVIYKVQHKVAGIVSNSGNILENLFKALVKKPLIGILLHLNQVWHVQNFINTCEAHANIFAYLHRFDIHHWLNHSIHIFTIHGIN